MPHCISAQMSLPQGYRQQVRSGVGALGLSSPGKLIVLASLMTLFFFLTAIALVPHFETSSLDLYASIHTAIFVHIGGYNRML